MTLIENRQVVDARSVHHAQRLLIALGKERRVRHHIDVLDAGAAGAGVEFHDNVGCVSLIDLMRPI
jgi:phage repressor protein C with HTH and peptisase S24 domain